jgi:hypothetical protein
MVENWICIGITDLLNFTSTMFATNVTDTMHKLVPIA